MACCERQRFRAFQKPSRAFALPLGGRQKEVRFLLTSFLLSSFLPPQHDELKSADFTPRLADGKRKGAECGAGLCASDGDGDDRRTLAMPFAIVKTLPDRSHPEAPAPASRQVGPRSAAAPPSASRRPTHRARPARSAHFRPSCPIRFPEFSFIHHSAAFIIQPQGCPRHARCAAALRRPPRSRRTRTAFGRPPAGSGLPPSSSYRGA